MVEGNGNSTVTLNLLTTVRLGLLQVHGKGNDSHACMYHKVRVTFLELPVIFISV
jgi:hypothetical protein